MKNLIILISLILVVAFTSNANAGTKKLVGELVNEGETLAVYTLEGRVVVHAERNVNDCFAGEYEVAIEPKGEAQFKLVETIFCRGKGKSFFGDEKEVEAVGINKGFGAEKMICPMIYAPVCGMINGAPQTFGNTCELANAKARKLFLGTCDQALSAGIKGHQDLSSFEIHQL